MIDRAFADSLERNPVIAAVKDDKWQEALASPAETIFYLKANLLTVRTRAEEARRAGKRLFVHIDLADGIGRDRTGVDYLADCGVPGIISTHGQLLAGAAERGLLTVQRFFALDSQGLESVRSCGTDLIEIMPGVIPKVIERFARTGLHVIAGGLIETKEEVMTALRCGAAAVSTGKKELWYL